MDIGSIEGVSTVIEREDSRRGKSACKRMIRNGAQTLLEDETRGLS
jgi:hypothetical protein